MPRGVNLVGVRYKNCVVVAEAERNQKGQKMWLCRCDCGVEFARRASKLSDTSHCGCLSHDNRSKSRKKHGLTRSSEFKAWEGAIQRCGNKNNKDFHRYGARGISVCDRWLHSFSAFLDDMGQKPHPEASLDRINVNGDYTPENCRWATPHQQASNRRNNVLIAQGGSQITLYEFCGFVRSPMYQRIAYRIRNGMCMADAVFQPARGL